MQEAIFNVQTITPLFLAGADQETAELRAPSFRGAMRYWLRALVGGGFGTDTERLKKVVAAETAVFGATDTGSAVRVKISEPDKKPSQFNEEITRRVGGKQQSTGKGYLLWSMKLKRPSRYYFAPNTNFHIYLSTPETDITKHKQAIAALWLLTNLGGIGSRSRRCAGSFTIKTQEGNTYNFSFDIPVTASDLKEKLEKGIKNARSICDVTLLPLRPAQFDILATNTCKIWILQTGEPWRTSEAALHAIGNSLQSYRSTLSLSQRKVFGFPLKGFRGSVDRRASPLHLRVTELQGNKYVGMAVLFKTANNDIVMKDYETIERWITTNFPNRLEVML